MQRQHAWLSGGLSEAPSSSPTQTANTSCKNVAPSSLPFKVVPPSFEHGLVLLATLIRAGGGVTSARPWKGNSSQNTILK